MFKKKFLIALCLLTMQTWARRSDVIKYIDPTGYEAVISDQTGGRDNKFPFPDSTWLRKCATINGVSVCSAMDLAVTYHLPSGKSDQKERLDPIAEEFARKVKEVNEFNRSNPNEPSRVLKITNSNMRQVEIVNVDSDPKLQSAMARLYRSTIVDLKAENQELKTKLAACTTASGDKTSTGH